MEIRLCDDNKIELDKSLDLEQRKQFVVNLIDGNLVYKDYYYSKEDGKIILDFLATYILNGEHITQKIKKEEQGLRNPEIIKTYFKNNTLIIAPTKETRTLKKIRVADKKIKRNNNRISELVVNCKTKDDFSYILHTIENLKFKNDELKKDLYYLIDDYIINTELQVNYGK